MRASRRFASRFRRHPGAASTETIVISGILVAILIGLLGAYRTYIRVAFVGLAAKITCAIDNSASGCQTGAGAAAPAGAPAGAPAINPATGLVAAPPGPAGGPPAPPPVVTGLGPNVDRFINASPDYARMIRDFLARGGTIVVGPAGGGTSYNRRLDCITIDANDIARGDIADIAGSLAHEAGHANFDPGLTPPDGLTEEQYVQANVNRRLAGEGEAVLKNFEMRHSLVGRGGGLTDVRGQLAAYERIYEQYLIDGDRAKARAAIGAIVAEITVSIPPHQKYKDYYGDIYRQKWADEHPGGAA
jgi:hypothetical protein